MELKGPRNQARGVPEATHQPDTRLTSSNKLAKAYKPRAIKANASMVRHSEPPVIGSRASESRHVMANPAAAKLHADSLDKPQDPLLMDSADAMTKDSLQMVPLPGKVGSNVNRYASTAGAPAAEDQDGLVKVGSQSAVNTEKQDKRARTNAPKV